MEYSDLTVVIPTLNEEKNIGLLMGKLQDSYKGINIIVSDDGSSDGTKGIVNKFAKDNGRIMFLDRSLDMIHGLTISVIDAAELTKTRYLVVMDGDMQHPAEVVEKIYKSLLEGNDIVVGVRKKVEKWGIWRHLISISASSLSHLVFKLRRKMAVSDMLSGFFGIKTALFKDIIKNNKSSFVFKGYKVLIDILRNVNNNAKIAEIPYVTFHERTLGKSKFRYSLVLNLIESLLK